MISIGNAQGWVLLVLGVAALGMEIYALVDALTHKTGAYPAAGKRTKNFWVIVLVVSVALGFISFQNILAYGILALLAVVAAGVYLADVRPALRQVTGKGSGQHQGPYGPW